VPSRSLRSMVETHSNGGGRPNLVVTCAWFASLLLVSIFTATLQQLYSVFLKVFPSWTGTRNNRFAVDLSHFLQ